MSRIRKMLVLGVVVSFAGCGAPDAPPSSMEDGTAAGERSEAAPSDGTLDMTTWSVAAVDPESGDVGVAVASCVETYGDAVAALVPGKGAAATQAGFDVRNRDRVFEAIQEGLTAEEVIARVTDPEWDDELDRRQYGVVTMHDDEHGEYVRVAG